MSKRWPMIFSAAVLCVSFATFAHAQMGAMSNFFRRPAMASMFRPVVGNGAVYESSSKDSDRKKKTEMLVVGKDSAGGKDGYWLEFGFETGSTGQAYSKVLVSTDDFQMHRVIFQLSGQPAMEMPYNPSSRANDRMADEMNKWSQAGSESVTVPAGTFNCVHWKKNGASDEIWSNDSVSPFSMVKEVSAGSTEVLVKVLTGEKDRIKGPVQPFDPQAFRQLMMQAPNQ